MKLKLIFRLKNEEKVKKFVFISQVNKFDDPKYAIHTLNGIVGHNYKSSNIHNFTEDSR